MKVLFTSTFKKHFDKLPKKVQQKFELRILIFMNNPFDPSISNHPLIGNLTGFRSFSVTGDYRVKFFVLDEDSVKLVDIGRHPQIYK